jgi:hypothetical protein
VAATAERGMFECLLVPGMVTTQEAAAGHWLSGSRSTVGRCFVLFIVWLLLRRGSRAVDGSCSADARSERVVFSICGSAGEEEVVMVLSPPFRVVRRWLAGWCWCSLAFFEGLGWWWWWWWFAGGWNLEISATAWV